jgi:hypothetical protein
MKQLGWFGAMRRDGSRHSLFVQRIPADVRDKAVGNPLAIPLGDGFVFVTPSASAQAVRFSLRSSDPTEIKTRRAVAVAFLEGVWGALRDDAPTKLSHKQATALAGELYRVWADSEGRARSTAGESVDERIYGDPAGGCTSRCVSRPATSCVAQMAVPERPNVRYPHLPKLGSWE